MILFYFAITLIITSNLLLLLLLLLFLCVYNDIGFNSRHPWYRVPHVFINIEDDEASEFNRAHAAFKTGPLVLLLASVCLYFNNCLFVCLFCFHRFETM